MTGCEIITLVKKLFWLAFILCDVFLHLTVEASVSRNPFLRPGSQQKPPPPPVQNNFKPKPIPQKDMSKEIEFRGYFVLKGKPFFCLLNKKSNHAEWISLSEITYEQFEASEFDMESEVLTVIYEGSRYDLSLIQGGASIGSGSSLPPRALSVTPSNKSSSSSTPTRYMPPRPKTTPKLPDWLAKKGTNTLPLPISRGASTGSGFSGSGVPRRITPSLPFPSGQARGSVPSETLGGSLPSLNQSTSRSAPTQSTSGSSSSPTITPSIENVSESSQSNGSTSNELDLDSLPPPPPPPNIVPPSPPPDIIPSREN